jgi:hypothetical protein
MGCNVVVVVDVDGEVGEVTTVVVGAKVGQPAKLGPVAGVTRSAQHP